MLLLAQLFLPSPTPILEFSEDSITVKAGVETEVIVTINPPDPSLIAEDYCYSECDEDEPYVDFEDTYIDDTHMKITFTGYWKGTIHLKAVLWNDEEIIAEESIPVTFTQDPVTEMSWADETLSKTYYSGASVAYKNKFTNQLVHTPAFGDISEAVITSSSELVEVEGVEFFETQPALNKWLGKFNILGVPSDPVTITATLGELTATFELTITSE